MKKLSLNGVWNLKGEHLTIQAKVPGEIHLDLKNAGVIEEPFLKRNLEKLRIYEGNKWTYSKEFSLDSNFLKNFKRVEIYFGGIDNHSEIFLNDRKIAETENSFIPYRFDITDLISRKNKIIVHIDDGLSLTPKEVHQKYIDIYHRNEDMRRLFLRKPQFVFGWDWTERILTCGLWRDVYINFYTDLALRNIWIKNCCGDMINIEIEIENFTEDKLKATIIFNIDGEKEKFIFYCLPGINTKGFKVKLPFVKLWYPHNIGEPFLYNIEIILISQKGIEGREKLRFGLRNVELIQENDGEGRSFIFRINGKKVFCRGANWVPADTIFPRVTKKKYSELINLAIEQGFNMLRIWGGGIYEDKYFYNLCDEKGIMLWQDFMFACGYYPDDKNFMKNVEQEVEVIVKELRNHPSIVLWCGNNENYTIYYTEKAKNPDLHFYGRKIFEELIPEKLKKLDPERFYWPSSDYSPSGDDPKSMKEGDRHSWYIPDLNLEKYKERGDRFFFIFDKAKFVSEFGRLAFSPKETIRRFAGKRRINLKDRDVAFHFNTFENFNNITEKLENYYGERIRNLSDEEIIKISQMQRGQSIEFALKYYASRKYRTAGALFWMYNDSWPTSTSWTSVDYYLNKTPLFWFVKRAFSDLIVFIKPDYIVEGDKYSIFVINHSSNSIKADFTYGIMDFYGKKVYEEKENFDIPGDKSILICERKLSEGIKQENYILYAYTDFEGKIIYDVQPVFFNFKNVYLPYEEIEVKKEKGKATLKSNIFHICVEVKGKTEDNYFSLLPGVPYKLEGDVENIDSYNRFLKGGIE